MSDGRYFLELATGTLAFIAYFFPVTVVVAVFWVCGVVATGGRIKQRPVRLVARCVIPSALTIGVLIVGVVCCYRGPPPWADGKPPVFPEYLIGGLVLAHLLLGGLLVWRSGGQWPVIAASSAVWAWASMCASIVAGMSVSGVWL
jgi:hypothetical protein